MSDKPCNGWKTSFNVLATEIERLEAQRDELARKMAIIHDLATRDDLDDDTETLRDVALHAREALKKAGCA